MTKQNETAQAIAQSIISEAEMDAHAAEAKTLIDENGRFQQKVMLFQQKTGATPQNVLLNYAMRKLSSPIIAP